MRRKSPIYIEKVLSNVVRVVRKKCKLRVVAIIKITCNGHYLKPKKSECYVVINYSIIYQQLK